MQILLNETNQFIKDFMYDNIGIYVSIDLYNSCVSNIDRSAAEANFSQYLGQWKLYCNVCPLLMFVYNLRDIFEQPIWKNSTKTLSAAAISTTS